jgi:LuxR family transcriptional regulator, maltose regulon positive regulatory protein
MFLGWLQALPDDAVRRSPVLSVFHGWMLMVSGDLAAVETRLDDAERALAAVPDGSAPPWADTDELRTLPATIAVYRAALAQARGDVAGTSVHAQHALDLAGPGDHLARGGAAGFLGLAAWAKGDVSTALRTFTEAVASLHAAGNLVEELSSTVVLADMWLAVGHPSEARSSYVRALQMAEGQGEPVPRATADLHVGLSELDCEAGDLHSAKQHLEVAAALEERASMTENRYRRFVSMGRVAEMEGDPEGAIALLEQAEALYVRGFFPYVRPIAAIKARVWIAQGSLSKAADWAREEGVSVLDDVDYLREFDHLTLVRLLTAQHRTRPETGGLDEALRLLDRLAGAAENGRAGSLVEIRMLQALALDAQGHRPQAVDALCRAWSVAPEPDGYVRLFLDEGEPMIGLLADAEQGIAGDHAVRLLRLASSRAEAPTPLQDPARSSAAELSKRELQVLRLLDSDLSAPEIARELFVSYNTVRTHTKHIFTKLDVSTRPAAVRRARECGLI